MFEEIKALMTDAMAKELMHGEKYEVEQFFRDNGVELEYVDNYGGEDMGSEYWAVWKFNRGEESCLIKFSGWYASHYGADYHGMKEVKPVTKTITIYQ